MPLYKGLSGEGSMVRRDVEETRASSTQLVRAARVTLGEDLNSCRSHIMHKVIA